MQLNLWLCLHGIGNGMMIRVFIEGVLVVSFAYLLYLYRFFIYHCYRRFPRHIYFYQHKTYQRSSSYRSLLFWAILYLGICGYALPSTLNLPLSVLCGLYSFFVLVSSLDFKLRLIPLRLLCGLAIFILSYRYIFEQTIFWEAQIHMGLIVCILWYITRQGIGFADIYLLFILSFLFPIEQWLWLLLSSALMGLFYMLMLRLMQMGSSQSIAFAPWICLSAWLMLWLA